MKYALIQFDDDSHHFAGQRGIQTINDAGELVDICDGDGDQMVAPGGKSASWTLIKELESDDFWEAVTESWINIDIIRSVEES